MRGLLLDITEAAFFFLFGGLYNSVSFVSTCLIEGAFQIVIVVRIDTVLPVFTGESQVHGHAMLVLVAGVAKPVFMQAVGCKNVWKAGTCY